MKNILFLLVLSFAVPACFAAEVDIGGDFKGSGFGGRGFPWYTNSHLKPKVTRHQFNGGIAVEVKALTEKGAQIYGKPVPASAGDKFTLSVLAKGTGTGRLELMLYDKNNRYTGGLKSADFPVTQEMVKYTKEFVIPSLPGREAASVRVGLFVAKDGDIWFQNAVLSQEK
ncbi:MAG: hypothetical protein IJU70_03640 [Lentisphaeria bacterium]|nr:hypothetical protein [Lentisphaeria bacterium]